MSEIVRQIGSGAGAMVGAAVGGVIGGGIQYGRDLISRPQPVDERAPLGERIGRSISNHRWTIAGTVIGAKVGSTLGSIAFLPVTIAVREFEEARGDFAKAAVFAGAVAGAFFLPQLIGVEYVLASELVRNTGCAIGACAVGAAARFFGWR